VSGQEAPGGSVTRFCTECGQCLVISTADLARSFRCPRCGSVYVAGSVVDHSTPIVAVPTSTHRPPQEQNGVAAQWAGAALPSNAPDTRAALPSVSDVQQVAMPTVAHARAQPHFAHGVAVAAMTASRLVTLADKVDSLLYGSRAKALVAAAAVVVFTPRLSEWLGHVPILQPIALAAFLTLAFVLGLARIAMFRNEDGQWDPAAGYANIKLGIADVFSGMNRLRDAHPKQRLQAIGSFFLGGALVSLAVRAALSSFYDLGFDSWDFDWSDSWDWLTLIGGGVVWAWARSATHRDGQRAALLADPIRDAHAAEAVAQAFAGLPTLVDCRDAELAGAFLRQSAHPLVTRLVSELGAWRPRWADTEKPYQHSLFRKLRGSLPEAEPQIEVPLRSQGLPYTGRIDILLGGCVLIEIKRHLTTSTAQKALGQIEMYAQIWHQKGPIVLVLCDTDPYFAASFFEPALARLRAAGLPVVAVLAA